MTQVNTDPKQQIILFCLIILGVLLFSFIVFRFIVRSIEQKRLKKISEENPTLKTAVELLQQAVKNISPAPLLIFQINKETALRIDNQLDNKRVIEEKRLFSYRYFIIDAPCVFWFKSKEQIEFKEKIISEPSTAIRFTKLLK